MENNKTYFKVSGFLSKGIFCLAILFSTSGCQKKFDSEKELWSYVKDVENGYSHEKKIGNLKYTLTYRPTDVLVKQTLTNNYDKNTIDSLRKKYGEYLYFNLSMSANNQELLNSKAGNKNNFGAMVNQLAFEMHNKIYLVSKSRDTVPLADYIYPRMYGMSNNTNILLVYPKDRALFENEFFHFTVQDLGFFTGEVGFKVPTKPILEEPRLTFDQTL
ncbi:hypothetical protein MTsPCn5_16470 [Croceitalea sp. MTPC5]|uniref:hypothetical protein n=1 Tax=Croceitalea sp. MTPC5 TaxID=3056565 RepID=UPI002B36BAB0|nr:hypothetical protein MTsPCn5_16470 [Croceitalea sp. MTPC5]